MTRSPLTLAASATAALPGVAVVSTASLTSSEAGRFDSAVVTLDDGRALVVRAPNDEDAARENAAEALALRALTSGARAQLPFLVPELAGEVGLSLGRAIVYDFLDGYRIAPADIPAGRGAATSIGAAISAVHALPTSVVRAEGLPRRSSAEARDAARTILDRASETRRLPAALAGRWRTAVEDDALWQFETTVVVGEAGALSFVFSDIADVPTVTGVLGWHGLRVDDPALDLHWLASAPESADTVYAAYTTAADRSPDAELRTRARLYAELEFAQWLVHGHEQRRTDIVDDAVELLDALVEGLGVHASSLASVPLHGVDDALAIIAAGTPAAAAALDDSDTSVSLQTDAYDPEMLSLYTAAAREDDETDEDDESRADDGGSADERAETAAPRERDDADSAADAADAALSSDPADEGTHTTPSETPRPTGSSTLASPDLETAPIDIGAWTEGKPAQPDEADTIELERASRAAIQRWASSGSE